MEIILIRHGKTEGNLYKRYIGRTDEELCAQGVEEIKSREYPKADVVISSPMKRCLQTAELIYQGRIPVLYSGLRECDFGDFEGKNYQELSWNEDYQAWIDSGGKLPFPNGEAHEAFQERCCEAFLQAVSEHSTHGSLAFVVHGGTIMAVLERFAVPKKVFYDYQVENGGGFVVRFHEMKQEMEIVSRL